MLKLCRRKLHEKPLLHTVKHVRIQTDIRSALPTNFELCSGTTIDNCTCFRFQTFPQVNDTTNAVDTRRKQLSIMVIYNSTWSKLIQWNTVILSGDDLTYKFQKKAYFLFVINLITRSKKIYRNRRSLKNGGTMHSKSMSKFTFVKKRVRGLVVAITWIITVSWWHMALRHTCVFFDTISSERTFGNAFVL